MAGVVVSVSLYNLVLLFWWQVLLSPGAVVIVSPGAVVTVVGAVVNNISSAVNTIECPHL